MKEVWFAGTHCDVGGGNTKDSETYALANIPLRWMVKEILAADPKMIFDSKKLASLGIELTPEGSGPNITTNKLDEKSRGIGGADTNIITDSPTSNHSDLAPAPGGGGTNANANTNGNRIPSGESDKTARSNTGTLSKRPKSGATYSTVTRRDSEEQTSDGDEATTSPTKRSAHYMDAIAPSRDELMKQPMWWLLEILPFLHSHQDEHSNWKKNLRYVHFDVA